jgi:hypothetical protein
MRELRQHLPRHLPQNQLRLLHLSQNLRQHQHQSHNLHLLQLRLLHLLRLLRLLHNRQLRPRLLPPQQNQWCYRLLFAVSLPTTISMSHE